MISLFKKFFKPKNGKSNKAELEATPQPTIILPCEKFVITDEKTENPFSEDEYDSDVCEEYQVDYAKQAKLAEQRKKCCEHGPINNALQYELEEIQEGMYERSFGLSEGWINTEGGMNQYGVDQSFFCGGLENDHSPKFPKCETKDGCATCDLYYPPMYFLAHFPDCYFGKRTFLPNPKYDKDTKEKVYPLDERHQKSKSGPGNWKCPVEECPYTTKYATSKMLHYRHHIKETPYKCPHCGKFTYTSYRLRQHLLRRHLALLDASNIVACEFSYCKERFLEIYDLKRHEASCVYKGFAPPKETTDGLNKSL